MIELAGNYFHLPRIIVKMFLLAGHFEVAAAGEIAIDSFFADNLFDTINRSNRGCVHSLRSLAPVH